jgi:hypothetical protein
MMLFAIYAVTIFRYRRADAYSLGVTNPQHTLEVALTRGVGQLASNIEYGITGTSVPTGIKRGANPSTTKVKVVKKEIVD